MSKAMKAAVMTAAGRPLETRDLPVPRPGAGEVLVRIEAFCFDAAEIIERGLQVTGSADGTRQELRQIMELADSERVRSVVTRVPLRDIDEAFQHLASGRVRGRQVIEIQ